MPNLQNSPSNRNRLPNRRQSVNFNFASAGLAYVCSYSLHADGSLGELFISNHKTNSAADTSARDAAITFSFAVQHGADPEAIRRALCRDSHGNPSGPLATALDRIAAMEGSL
jgi:hypothetical protein